MKRILIFAALATLSLILASAASGASLGLRLEGGGSVGLFNIGDPITLEITATVADGELSQGLDVRVLSDGSVEWTGSVQAPLTTFDGAIPWTQHAVVCPPGPGSETCVAVNQSHPVQPDGPFDTDAFDGVLATVTGVVQGAGFIDVNPRSFFDLPIQPNAVEIQIVPEPGTIALVAIGCIWLSAARHRC